MAWNQHSVVHLQVRLKLHLQKNKQRKYYRHVKVVQLNSKATIEPWSNFFKRCLNSIKVGAQIIFSGNLFQILGTQ